MVRRKIALVSVMLTATLDIAHATMLALDALDWFRTDTPHPDLPE